MPAAQVQAFSRVPTRTSSQDGCRMAAGNERACKVISLSYLLKLHDVRVHETPVVLNFPLHILRDLQMTRTVATEHAAKTAPHTDCRHWVAEVKLGRGGWGAGRGGPCKWTLATCLVTTLDELYRDLLARCLVERELHEAERATVEISNLRTHAPTVRPLSEVAPQASGHDRWGWLDGRRSSPSCTSDGLCRGARQPPRPCCSCCLANPRTLPARCDSTQPPYCLTREAPGRPDRRKYGWRRTADQLTLPLRL